MENPNLQKRFWHGELPAEEKCYIATMQAFDEESRAEDRETPEGSKREGV